MNGRVLTIAAGFALMLLGGALLWPSTHRAVGSQERPAQEAPGPEEPAAPAMRVTRIDIPPEATFSELMKEAGVDAETAAEIHAASVGTLDLATIRAGKAIDLVYDAERGDLKELVYAPNPEEELRVTVGAAGWTARLEPIAYDVRVKTAEGAIESSLYESALKQGLDDRTIVAMADVFQWTIDFAQDVRVGDSYKFIYEERWRDGRYVMPGRVLAAKYVNDGVEKRAFLYANADGEEGYYDEEGGSLRKMFLKAPVAFKYITSGFTTGRRYVAAFNVSTGHRAIDYAAKSGTPIRATADGTVVYAGWNGSYGNFVSVRHNGTYTTNYAHQSRIAVKKGQKVSQGQVIGYVGSTGFSTGPHLHYEMVKNGTKINPLREVFPGTDPIKPEEMEAFKAAIAKWKDAL